MPFMAGSSGAYFEGPNQLNGPFDVRINLWTARRQRSQELKQLYEADWIRYWKWYRNWAEPMEDPADWWRSNEVIPTVYKVVETLLPRYVIGMFDTPDWFTVEARQARDADYEGMCESLLRATMEEMELFPKMYEALKYALIMGHCWGKIVWKEEYTERQVLIPTPVEDDETGEPVMGVEAQVVTEEAYNNVDFDWLTLDRVFPDPTGEQEWFIEEIDTTVEKLQDVQDHLGVYNKTEFAALMASIPPPNAMMKGGDSLSDARSGTSAGVSVEYAREPEATEGIPFHFTTPMRDGIGIKLWQCWGWVPQELREKDNSAWRLTVIAEGKYVLRDEPSPTPDGRPPYFPIKSIPIPKRLYGESILRYIGPLADQQSRLANMRLDEVFLGVWQQYLYKADSVVSDNQFLIQPAGVIEVRPDQGESIKDVFSVLERKPVLPDAWTEDQYRQTQAEHAAAASDIMQGVGAQDRQTATEVERKIQQGNARHMLYTMWNDYTVKKELLERTWKWLQMRMSTPRLVRTVGEEFAAVDLAEIQIPIDIIVSGGMFALSKETRLQMDQELVALAANPAFALYLKPEQVLRKLMQDRGWKDPDKYIRTEEEVLLQQMMAMQAQGAMGGGGAPGEDQNMGAESGQPNQGPGAGAAQFPGGGGGNGQNGPMQNVQNPGDRASVAGGIVDRSGAPIADTGL
jgi:hypothetical protein